LAKDRTLIAVPHLSFPDVWQLRHMGSGYKLMPIHYGNRTAALDAAFSDPHKDGDKPEVEQFGR
jgi:hypothetical protein